MLDEYFYIPRSIIKKSWYKDKYASHVFIHFLAKANQDGVFTTTLQELSSELNISISAIKRAISKLKLSNEIKTKTDFKNITFSILNYEKYSIDRA